MAWKFCTSGSAISKAGADADSVIVLSGSVLSNWSDEAENYICAVARNDLITNFSSLKANGKQVLQRISSAMVAQNIVSYNLSSYPSSRVAETIMDKLEDEKEEGIKILNDDNIKTYLDIT